MEARQSVNQQKPPLVRRVSNSISSFFMNKKVTSDELINTNLSSKSNEQSSSSTDYDSPIISNFEPSPRSDITAIILDLDNSNRSISSLCDEEHYHDDSALTDESTSCNALENNFNLFDNENVRIAPDNTWLHWALLHFPPTLNNAGILLLASGLTLLAIGFIASTTSILMATGTAIAGAGALLSFYGHYNPSRHESDEETIRAERVNYPSPASSVV